MPNSSATDRIRLLKPSTLILVAAVAVGLLWLTFHHEEDFVHDTENPDMVSANYAELLLAARPDDGELRVQLIEALTHLGDFERARRHLREWPNPDPQQLQFYSLETEALAVLASGSAEAMPAMVSQLQGLELKNLSVRQLQRLAKNALALQAPGLAARAYLEMAEREPDQRIERQGEAARWYLASGEPLQAAALYQRMAADSEDPEQRKAYAQLAFASLLAAGQGEEAAVLLSDELDKTPASTPDPAWLEQGVQVAVQHRRFDLAERFVTVWRELQPDNVQALETDLRIRLATGDIAGARQAGQLLLEHRPDDPKLLEQLAQLDEWSGNSSSALAFWMRLLKLEEDPARREHAWRLASQLYDFDNSIPLLEVVSDQRRLSDVELDALIYAHESRGTPEQAERWLRRYLQRHPHHRLGWSRLLQNLNFSQQHQAETQAWKSMAERFPLTIEERLSWAEAHWKLYDVQGAWQVLDVQQPPHIDNHDYWRLRAALAWELERDDELRKAYEQLLANGATLDVYDEARLIDLYRLSEPRKALELLSARWRRSHNGQHLAELLALAQELGDWQQLQAIVDEASKVPPNADLPFLWASRGLLAEHAGRPDEAERIYQQGLKRFPREGLFRERLLWLYVDHGNRAALGPLLQQWRSVARRDSRLWLPFASASQLLNRNRDALAWFRLYLGTNPSDWLVRAAYADALEAAGYQDSALRLRTELVGMRSRGEVPMQTPQHYRTWLRLLTSAQSGQAAGQQVMRWQDGSEPMLQLWFEDLLAQLDAINQERQKDEWLSWARSRGLKVERYDRIQEALRNWNSAELERMLAAGELDAPQRVAALGQLGEQGRAVSEALSALSDEQPQVLREQLWRQAVELHEGTPQGIQLGWRRQDFGGLEVAGPRLQIARQLGDDWYADLQMERVDYSADNLIASRLGEETNAELLLRRRLRDGNVGITLDASLRDDENRQGLGLSRLWQLGASDELEAGLDWQRQNSDTGLMRALGQHDGVWLAARHRLSARDQLAWRLEHQRYSTRDGQSLGSGDSLNLEINHVLQFEGPTWVLRSGVDYQRNSLDDNALDGLASLEGGPLRIDAEDAATVTPQDLLQDRYGQLYLGSSWRRGFPGALNRTRGQYTWLVDVMAGWQWTESSFNYGITTGVGIELVGDDELALTLGYQSAPQGGDGEAGAVLGATYSLRFGR